MATFIRSRSAAGAPDSSSTANKRKASQVLEWVGVAGTGVGWLSRWRLHSLLSGREAEYRRMRLLIPSS